MIALEFLVWKAWFFALVLHWVHWIVIVGIGFFVNSLDNGSGLCCLCRPVEDGSIEACNVVEQEVVELVVLQVTLARVYAQSFDHDSHVAV